MKNTHPNARFRSPIIPALLVALLFQGHSLQAAETLECRAADRHKANHLLKITTQDDKIVEILYGSMSAQGHTCEFEATRGEQAYEWLSSVWRDEGGITYIDMYAQEDGAPKTCTGKIKIERGKKFYKLQVLEYVSSKICGLNGHIAKGATLHIGKERCVLSKD